MNKLIPTKEYALKLAKQYAYTEIDKEIVADLMYNEQLAVLEAIAKLENRDYKPEEAKDKFRQYWC